MKLNTISVIAVSLFFFSLQAIGQESKAKPVQLQQKVKSYSGVHYDQKSDQYFVNNRANFILRTQEKDGFVDRIEYSVDESPFQVYSQKLNFEKEGAHVLRFKAVDPVNNWSPIQTFQIYVDLTSPITKHGWRGPFHMSGAKLFISKETKLSLNSIDQLSGVDKTLWRPKDASSFQLYPSPLKFPNEGEYTIEFSSYDKIGNKEPLKSVSFVVDGTAPKSKVKLIGNTYQSGEKIYTNLGSALELLSSDLDSGVKKIEYQINDGSINEYQNKLAIEQNNTLLKFRAVDFVGNQEEWQQYRVYLDTQAPSIKLAKSGKHKKINGRVYALPGLEISALSEDSQSGVAQLVVRGIASPAESKNQFKAVFSQPGSFSVSLFSVDEVGNKSEMKNLELVIDEAAPSTQAKTSQPTLVRDDVHYSNLPNSLSFISDDADSGVSRIEYSYDGQNFVPFEKAIDLATWSKKERTVFYRAVDLLGNTEDVKSMNIHLKDRGPSVALFVETADQGDVALSKLKKAKKGKRSGSRALAGQKK